MLLRKLNKVLDLTVINVAIAIAVHSSYSVAGFQPGKPSSGEADGLRKLFSADPSVFICIKFFQPPPELIHCHFKLPVFTDSATFDCHLWNIQRCSNEEKFKFLHSIKSWGLSNLNAPALFSLFAFGMWETCLNHEKIPITLSFFRCNKKQDFCTKEDNI